MVSGVVVVVVVVEATSTPLAILCLVELIEVVVKLTNMCTAQVKEVMGSFFLAVLCIIEWLGFVVMLATSTTTAASLSVVDLLLTSVVNSHTCASLSLIGLLRLTDLCATVWLAFAIVILVYLLSFGIRIFVAICALWSGLWLGQVLIFVMRLLDSAWSSLWLGKMLISRFRSWLENDFWKSLWASILLILLASTP